MGTNIAGSRYKDIKEACDKLNPYKPYAIIADEIRCGVLPEYAILAPKNSSSMANKIRNVTKKVSLREPYNDTEPVSLGGVWYENVKEAYYLVGSNCTLEEVYINLSNGDSLDKALKRKSSITIELKDFRKDAENAKSTVHDIDKSETSNELSEEDYSEAIEYDIEDPYDVMELIKSRDMKLKVESLTFDGQKIDSFRKAYDMAGLNISFDTVMIRIGMGAAIGEAYSNDEYRSKNINTKDLVIFGEYYNDLAEACERHRISKYYNTVRLSANLGMTWEEAFNQAMEKRDNA